MTCWIAWIEQGVNKDVFQTDRLNALFGSLDEQCPVANSQPFNRNTSGTKLLKKWDLPSHGSGIRVGRINRDIGTRDRILFNFLKSCSKDLGIVIIVSHNYSLLICVGIEYAKFLRNMIELTDQFNLIPGVHSGHNKAPRDSTIQGVIPVTIIHATEKYLVSTKVRPPRQSARQLSGQSMNCVAPLRAGFEFSQNKT